MADDVNFTDTLTLSSAAWFNNVNTKINARLTSVSGVDTITAAGPSTLAAYASGQRWSFVSAGANTGAVTLNITPSGGSALGARAITKNGAVALFAGDIPSGALVYVEDDGTRLQLIGKSAIATNIVEVHTGNGHGSTNTKIRRFTTTMTNTGTAITYADSAANGATFTINTPGLYEVHYRDAGAAAVDIGISLDSAELTTAVQSITIATLKAHTVTNGANAGSLTKIIRCAATSVIRPHTDGVPNSTSSATSFFSVQYLGA